MKDCNVLLNNLYCIIHFLERWFILIPFIDDGYGKDSLRYRRLCLFCNVNQVIDKGGKEYEYPRDN